MIFFSMRTIPIRTFVPTNFLPLRIFYIRTLYHTNICIRTFPYELLLTYYIQTNFIPYEHLLTNFLRTNNLLRNFAIRTFSIRISVPTYFSHYEYFTYVLYTIRKSAYELKRTNFCVRTFFKRTLSLTNNCV